MLRPAEREALRLAEGAVIALGDDGLIAFATPSAQQLLGWDDGLVGQPLSAIVPPRLLAPQKVGLRRFVATKGLHQTTGVHTHPARCRDGSERPVHIKVVGFERPDGSLFLCSWLADDGSPAPEEDVPVALSLASKGYRRT